MSMRGIPIVSEVIFFGTSKSIQFVKRALVFHYVS